MKVGFLPKRWRKKRKSCGIQIEGRQNPSGSGKSHSIRSCARGKISPPGGWAVRSSALGEDSQISYAGQYATVLNVPSSQMAWGYKQVVASLFSPQVMAYRQEKRVEQKEMAMAVGCTSMISPLVSGVTYTADPTRPEGEEMILSVCWGLGKLVVEGDGETDIYRVVKTPPYSLSGRHIGQKTKQYIAGPGSGVSLVPVPDRTAGTGLPGRFHAPQTDRRGPATRAVYEVLSGY